jgi:threonine dehydrogenase-like Zn-dependent dehydrogenase
MRGLWLEEGRLTLRDDLPEPEPGPGEAVIQVCLAGICATDLELVRGYYPYAGILGHEFVGEVVWPRDDPELEDRRVVGEISVACGDCPTCRSGRPGHCAARTVLGIKGRHGCFAERVVLPLENLRRVPDHVSDEAAVFCEPLAAALELGEQVHLRATDRVLLVGAGRLGQLMARVLALRGVDLEVVARHDRQRRLLREVGARPTEADQVEKAAFDVVIEASGSPDGFALARRAVRPRGTLVLKSTYAGRLELDTSALVVDEITLVGSRCGPFAPALRLLERGVLDLRALVDARYPLAEGLTAFDHATKPGALKVLLDVAKSRLR